MLTDRADGPPAGFVASPETDGWEGMSTRLLRNFLRAPDDEPIELTAFVKGNTLVTYASDFDAHVELLRQIQTRQGFAGAYQLVNSIDPAIVHRYPANEWRSARENGRASDRDIVARRALFIDVDPVRPKGISATDDEHAAARDVSATVESFLAENIGASSVRRGCSGNGFFVLVAIEPTAPTPENAQRIQRFLKLLQKKFNTDGVSVDGSVWNAARLMPCPGTMKRKGISSRARPHRRVTFPHYGAVHPVPLETIC